ncbi:MAG: chemotaxis protein CheX [Lachnospiraceae bacterium]|nr:chemotaxis protein CheX [Lachnospiraceae bacterium]
MKALDVKHINPFLQSTLSIMEQTTGIKLAVGKPAVGNLLFPNNIFILQVGVTGALKGQVLLVMEEDNAKSIASKMMMGMPVDTLDDMASSALCELSTMIMGSTATLFSTEKIVMDITPPISLYGNNLKLQTDMQALKIPMAADGVELVSLYLCLGEED